VVEKAKALSIAAEKSLVFEKNRLCTNKCVNSVIGYIKNSIIYEG
jgi:hypothetical protein